MIINQRSSRQGQVLLIVVMLLATALTVVLTASYQSVTETQITKLEEENQKALAAAEAGIEAVLNQKTDIVNIGSLPNLSDFSGEASIQEVRSNKFITPLLQKDEEYTLYLVDYNPQTKTLGTTSTAQNIFICFGSSSYNPALEITLIKNNNLLKRYVVNPQGNTLIQNGSAASSPTFCPDQSFTNQYTISASDIGTNTQFLIVRIINNVSGSTRVGFQTDGRFPIQGTTIVSTAKSSVGVEKKIQLFQSYPQIPTEFFITTF